eukprot:TRINITY_DN14786_c0_g1_i1.p1 TRINITY_DN14786_c0_g1~~TRINITY_DN14786_c0_g1_i1.p1  ORF type:complete len:431 (+),score=45.98 TRINITY_DN14786_c0_g1_i1:105-1397(+)
MAVLSRGPKHAFVLFYCVGIVGAGCPGGGNAGCGPPRGERWDTWSMRASTYTYCYKGCVVDWLYEHTAALGLGEYAGVAGVDHYWTHQGLPCAEGVPQEFAMQDALALKWKGRFPQMRFLQYRILSAVPSDAVVHRKITSDPDAAVRWRHLPGSDRPGNGSVCYNYLSSCFNDPKRMNDPLNECPFEIRAAAYNWSNPAMPEWYLNAVVKPAMVHADGIWLDGIGPDNGAWMCSAAWGPYGPDNSPLNQKEIDAHCAGQTAAATAAQQWLIANGGWEAMQCFDFLGPDVLPTADDDPAQCAAKLEKMAAFGADHKNYNHVVSYGSRTGGRAGYNDTTAAGTVAAFLLVRGQHWLFSIAPTGGRVPPTPRTPHDAGTLLPETARLLLSDYGRPTTPMERVPGAPGRYQRRFEKATVALDCSHWHPTFDEHD